MKKHIELEQPGSVGRSPPRRDGADKVTGRARYLDDLSFPGQLWGRTVRSRIPHGRIKGIWFDPGFDWADVIRVTAADIPGENVVHLIEDDQPILARDLIRHCEEPIALLACADREKLEQALEHVRVEVEELTPVLDPLQSTTVFKSYRIEHNTAGLASAFAKAHRVIEGEYRVGHQEHMYIEPQAVCAVPRDGGGITIYGSCQCPFYMHRALERILAVDESKIAVIQVVTGGGFGGKEEYPSVIAGHAALLAHKAGRPVKMIYKREEDVAATTKRHPAVMKHRTAVAKDGTLLGCEIEIVMDGGAYVTLSPVVLSRGVLHSAGAYRWPSARIDCKVVRTHTPPNGAFRGFGVPQTIFAIEAQMEKVAHELGIDPLELRRKNALRMGDVLPTGQKLEQGVSAREVLDAVAAHSDFASKRAEYAPQNGSKRRGIGISLALHGAGFTGSGEARLKARAGIELTERGARVLSVSTDIGQGTTTIFAQMAADALGLPLDDVEVAEPDTSRVPDSGPTVASRTTMVVGGTVVKAARALGVILQGHAAKLHGVPASEVECRQGVFRARGRALAPFAAIARRYLEEHGPLVCIEQYRPPPGIEWDDQTYRGDAYPCYAWAATVVEVEVDLDTFEVALLDVVQAAEIGKAIHPVLAEGQIEGGTVQALGYALLEEHVWSHGRILNTRMQNYLIPTSLDVPSVHTLLLENPYPPGPYGAKGMGELPMNGPAPAVAAAVLHATGKLVSELPISPDRLMRALERP
jgi:CO/xanthine dehydrogenase Mo-binding subunit